MLFFDFDFDFILDFSSLALPEFLCFFSLENLEMIVPEVDKKLLEELEAMGFPTARATRALHYSGESFGNCYHIISLLKLII